MKSRAELLAELEEKRLENNNIPSDIEVLSIDVLAIEDPGAAVGYDPYDNPGLGKEMPDDADITERRRRIMRRIRGD